MGSQFKNEIFILFVSNSRNEFILRGEEFFFFSDAGEFLIGGNFKNKRAGISEIIRCVTVCNIPGPQPPPKKGYLGKIQFKSQ